MYGGKNSIYYVKIVTKVVVSIICYLAFTIYTVPTYHNVRAYVDEKFSSKRAVVVGSTPLVVEIVDEPGEREIGLSGRSELEKGTGMLFIFEKKDFHGIWMKNMNFSIDIIWFNEYGEVIDFLQNINPDTYPAIFKPKEKSKYIIEVPAGFIFEEGIKIGDTIDL